MRYLTPLKPSVIDMVLENFILNPTSNEGVAPHQVLAGLERKKLQRNSTLLLQPHEF